MGWLWLVAQAVGSSCWFTHLSCWFDDNSQQLNQSIYNGLLMVCNPPKIMVYILLILMIHTSFNGLQSILFQGDCQGFPLRVALRPIWVFRRPARQGQLAAGMILAVWNMWMSSSRVISIICPLCIYIYIIYTYVYMYIFGIVIIHEMMINGCFKFRTWNEMSNHQLV